MKQVTSDMLPSRTFPQNVEDILIFGVTKRAFSSVDFAGGKANTFSDQGATQKGVQRLVEVEWKPLPKLALDEHSSCHILVSNIG